MDNRERQEARAHRVLITLPAPRLVEILVDSVSTSTLKAIVTAVRAARDTEAARVLAHKIFSAQSKKKG